VQVRNEGPWVNFFFETNIIVIDVSYLAIHNKLPRVKLTANLEGRGMINGSPTKKACTVQSKAGLNINQVDIRVTSNAFPSMTSYDHEACQSSCDTYAKSSDTLS